MQQDKKTGIIITLVIAVAIIGTAAVLSRPVQTTPGERLGNAVDELADGVDEAAEELDPNRTVGEKIGDELEDMGEELQEKH